MTRRQVWFIRGLYMAIWGAVGTFWPFVYVHYRAIGLTGTQVGLVVTLSSLMGTLSATAWGMVNDRLGRTRVLLTIQLCGASAACLALSQMHSFATILPVAGLFSVFTSPIMPLLDSTTLRVLGEHRDQYGAFRAWGTVGFVITCAAAGFYTERLGMRVIFPSYCLGLVLFGVLAWRLPDGPVARGLSRLAGLGPMVRRPAWAIFALSVFLLWAAVMGAYAFMGIVIVEMGGAQRLVGLSSTIAALTEIPLLQYGPRLLRRFGSTRLVTTAMAIYALRLLLYGLMPDASWVLWLALLQGASYGPFLIGAVAYTNDTAPSGLKSTAQGLLVSVMSLANVVAGLAGGWLFDHTGRHGLFFTMMCVCCGALGLFVLGRQWAARRASNTPG